MKSSQSEDLDKLNFYLKIKFEFYETLLLSNGVKKPQAPEIKKMLNSIGKHEIECLYNHFHMSAISDSILIQKEYAIKIWNKWRSNFNQQMPDKKIAIEIRDYINEIILYVYEISI